MNSNAQGFRR